MSDTVKRPKLINLHQYADMDLCLDDVDLIDRADAYMDQQAQTIEALSTALDTAIEERDEMYKSYNAIVLIPKLRAATAENVRLMELLRGVSDGKCGNIRPYGPKEVAFTKCIYDMFAPEDTP